MKTISGWNWAIFSLVCAALTIAVVACTGIDETTLVCGGCVETSVSRAIDGDTLETSRGLVRLFGVDTPERGQQCASEAKARLGNLAGDSIRLEFGPRETDQYQRILSYAYTMDGLSIDEILIREGLARAWTKDGQHRDYLVGLESEAKDKSAGCLW